MATGLMEDGKVKPAQSPLHSVVQVRSGDRGTTVRSRSNTPEWVCGTSVPSGAELTGSLRQCRSVLNSCILLFFHFY